MPTVSIAVLSTFANLHFLARPVKVEISSEILHSHTVYPYYIYLKTLRGRSIDIMAKFMAFGMYRTIVKPLQEEVFQQ